MDLSTAYILFLFCNTYSVPGRQRINNKKLQRNSLYNNNRKKVQTRDSINSVKPWGLSLNMSALRCVDAFELVWWMCFYTWWFVWSPWWFVCKWLVCIAWWLCCSVWWVWWFGCCVVCCCCCDCLCSAGARRGSVSSLPLWEESGGVMCWRWVDRICISHICSCRMSSL